MYVIGTAGHVDHGKSTLVQALTGIDPDRLREEKERGMTIDLGFAWLKLPGGHEVSIVDVPGHERFIKNMLAGVGGIDAAVLVIAADEGVMPQTREHLAILDLLAIPTGLIALTKIDLVRDPDWLELVQLDIMEAVQGTVLDGRPIVPVSARTGEGLDRLVTALMDLLRQQPARRDVGTPRLPVDRVFTIAGFGVVVTGTLLDGSLRVGQEVELQPSGVRARIRGMQSHEQEIELADPGRRLAVNLRGVERGDVARGHVLGLPGAWRPTTLLDASLRYLTSARLPLAHGDSVKVFVGAAEVMGQVRILDRDEVLPGDEAWIQLRLEAPLVAARGDRFILRRPSPAETIGGGVVLDTAPGRRWRRFRPEVIARFETLAAGDAPTVALLGLSQANGPLRVAEVPLSEAERASALAAGRLIALNAEWVIHPDTWERLRSQAVRALEEFHRAAPLRVGMPRDQLRGRLRLDISPFEVVLPALINQGVIVPDEGGAIRLPEHRIRYSAAQEDALRRLWGEFERAPHTPPTYSQAAALVGEDVLISLLERGELVRISDEVIFAPAVLREWIDVARAALERGEPLTVATLRDRFGTTRRYTLDFLERLDALGITRRSRDERVRGSGAWERLLG